MSLKKVLIKLILATSIGVYFFDPVMASSLTYRVGLMDFYPFAYFDDDGSPYGPSYDFLHAFKSETGLDLHIEILPMKRALTGIQTGKTDMTFSYRIASLDESVYWLDRLGCLNDLVVPLKTANIASVSELTGKTIAAGNGGFFHQSFAPPRNIKVLAAPKYSKMVRLALAGRVQGLSINEAIYHRLFILGDEPEENLPANWREQFDEPVRTTQFVTSLSVSRMSELAKQKDKLSVLIADMRARGIFDEIMRTHRMSFQKCDPVLQLIR